MLYLMHMIDEKKQNMKWILYSAFALFSLNVFAQEPLVDNTTVVASAVINPKVTALQEDNAQYRAELELLETEIPTLQQLAQDLQKEARASADDNRDAARRLQGDVTDASKARKARKTAKQAEKDSDRAEKAQKNLEKAQKKVASLKKKIEKNEKKILKLQSEQ
jgi:hypothetical protein